MMACGSLQLYALRDLQKKNYFITQISTVPFELLLGIGYRPEYLAQTLFNQIAQLKNHQV